MDRMESLKTLLAQDPQNRLVHYGLAMELVKLGRLEEAVAEFQALLRQAPDYCYAYFHCGQTLERLDRIDEARETYRLGIETAERGGDGHARAELQQALDILG